MHRELLPGGRVMQTALTRAQRSESDHLAMLGLGETRPQRSMFEPGRRRFPGLACARCDCPRFHITRARLRHRTDLLLAGAERGRRVSLIRAVQGTRSIG
jgi:hypothetical protein